MTLQINPELKKYIDPLTTNEYQALERSILREGCRDALILWGNTLIDGHNRYAICEQHGLPYKTVQNSHLQSIEDVILWLIDNHIGRRSVSDFQRGMLALRQKEIIESRSSTQKIGENGQDETITAPEKQAGHNPKEVREEIAKSAGISQNAVSQIEKIQRTATPTLVDAVREGTISISAAAAIASLPDDEQRAAVSGGKKDLQQAAKLARELKSSMRAKKVPNEVKNDTTIDADQGLDNETPISVSDQTNETTSNSSVNSPEQSRKIAELEVKLAELVAENFRLKQENDKLNQALALAQQGNSSH